MPGHLLEHVGEILRAHDRRRQAHELAVGQRGRDASASATARGVVDGRREAVASIVDVGVAVVRRGDILGELADRRAGRRAARSGESVRIVPLRSTRSGMMLCALPASTG